MKLSHLWSITITSIIVGITSATVDTPEKSSLLRRLLTDALRTQANLNTNGNVAEARGVVLPSLSSNIPDYDYINSQIAKRRHIRRGAPYPRRRPHFPSRGREPPKKSGSTRRKLPCGFLTELDMIGYNPDFGCKRKRAQLAAKRRW